MRHTLPPFTLPEGHAPREGAEYQWIEDGEPVAKAVMAGWHMVPPTRHNRNVKTGRALGFSVHQQGKTLMERLQSADETV